MQSTNTSDLLNQNLPADSLNANLTAIPKGAASADEASADPDLVASPMEFGTMNERDARESGYIGKNGKAVSKSRKNKKGSPTGAYTDIGAGRSSAVTHKTTNNDNNESHQHSERRTSMKAKAQKQNSYLPALLVLGGGALLYRYWSRGSKAQAPKSFAREDAARREMDTDMAEPGIE
jgi:hypothetical protein